MSGLHSVEWMEKCYQDKSHLTPENWRTHKTDQKQQKRLQGLSLNETKYCNIEVFIEKLSIITIIYGIRLTKLYLGAFW